MLRKDVFGPRNTWIVVFEHAMPLISLNGFALASIVLGFLWAKRNYQAHSHNKIIFDHKATYWKMITTLDKLPSKEARTVSAELLKEVIKVSPSSGYEKALRLFSWSEYPRRRSHNMYLAAAEALSGNEVITYLDASIGRPQPAVRPFQNAIACCPHLIPPLASRDGFV